MSLPATSGTWAAGLANQARREASMWWGTSRWWRQAIGWTAVLGGLLAVVLWLVPAVLEGVEGGAVALGTAEAASQFAELATVVSAVGVVILAQGLLLDDQRSGLAEWLLSKPLSRTALVLAKLVGHAGGLLFAVVLAPWVAVYAVLSAAGGGLWPLGRFLGTMALVGAFVVFHLALVLALSALVGSRGAVLAVPLALLVGSDLLLGLAPWAANGSPYLVSRIAGALLGTGTLVAVWPVVATVAWTVVLSATAVWRFSRQEL